MVEAYPVLQVADGILDLGPATVASFGFQSVDLAVGNERELAVGGKQCQPRAGRDFLPPHDEPRRHRVGLAGNGGVGGLGYVGSTRHPVGDGRPVCLGYGVDKITLLGVLADGDEVAYILS